MQDGFPFFILLFSSPSPLLFPLFFVGLAWQYQQLLLIVPLIIFLLNDCPLLGHAFFFFGVFHDYSEQLRWEVAYQANDASCKFLSVLYTSFMLLVHSAPALHNCHIDAGSPIFFIRIPFQSVKLLKTLEGSSSFILFFIYISHFMFTFYITFVIFTHLSFFFFFFFLPRILFTTSLTVHFWS